jgi:hypothetical protein
MLLCGAYNATKGHPSRRCTRLKRQRENGRRRNNKELLPCSTCELILKISACARSAKWHTCTLVVVSSVTSDFVLNMRFFKDSKYSLLKYDDVHERTNFYWLLVLKQFDSLRSVPYMLIFLLNWTNCKVKVSRMSE